VHRTPRFTISPFVQALDACSTIDVWATPSIIPGLHVPIKTGEYSVSVTPFGSHLDNTGLLGDVARRAAVHRFADDALISCSGSTTSNHKVMVMLASEFPGRPIVVSRNCHHSIISSAQIYGVTFQFIDNPDWIDEYDAILPPTKNDVQKALSKFPNTCAVVLSSPTYEGIIADIEDIGEVVHSHGALLWVDQAWGSHLGASKSLPPSAMQLGADIVCESVHKNGGAIQGSALLLWRKGKFPESALYEAHTKIETTSPNFNIFASIDAALLRRSAEPELMDDLCLLISSLKNSLLREKDLSFLHSGILPHRPHLLLDPTRLCIGLNEISGAAMRRFLESRFIEVEKIGRKSILAVATFQLHPHAAHHLAHSVSAALKECPRDPSLRSPLPAPYHNSPLSPALLPAQRGYTRRIVPLHASIGLISDELAECYPPGIPILIPGFRITEDHVRYILAMKEHGASIILSDKSLASVRVRMPDENESTTNIGHSC
jgi:arginine decarboxylase